jgi:hypothetical protein
MRVSPPDVPGMWQSWYSVAAFIGPLAAVSVCPYGHDTRPWKWFTRQSRVSH